MRAQVGVIGSFLVLLGMSGCADSNYAAIKDLERARLEKRVALNERHLSQYKAQSERAVDQAAAAQKKVDALREELKQSELTLKNKGGELDQAAAIPAKPETTVSAQDQPQQDPQSASANDSDSREQIRKLESTIASLRAQVEELSSHKKLLEDTLADVKVTLGEMRNREKMTRELPGTEVPDSDSVSYQTEMPQ